MHERSLVRDLAALAKSHIPCLKTAPVSANNLGQENKAETERAKRIAASELTTQVSARALQHERNSAGVRGVRRVQ